MQQTQTEYAQSIVGPDACMHYPGRSAEFQIRHVAGPSLIELRTRDERCRSV